MLPRNADEIAITLGCRVVSAHQALITLAVVAGAILSPRGAFRIIGALGKEQSRNR